MKPAAASLGGALEETQFPWRVKSLAVPPAQVGVVHGREPEGGSQRGSPEFGKPSPLPKGSSLRPPQIPGLKEQGRGGFYSYLWFFNNFLAASRSIHPPVSQASPSGIIRAD